MGRFGGLLLCVLLGSAITPRPVLADRAALGAEAGLNVAFGSTGAGTNGGPRLGVLAGATFEWTLTDVIALHGGLRYAQKGARAELANLLRISVAGTLELDAVEVPLQVALRYPLPRFTPFAVVGPVLSFIARKSFQMDTFNFIQTDIDQRFGTFDFIFETTAGCEFPLSRDIALSLWARYAHGFSDLDSSPATFQSRAFATGLSTAYRF